MDLFEDFDDIITAGNPYGSDLGDPLSADGLNNMYVASYCRQPGEVFYVVDKNNMPDYSTLQALRDAGWKIKLYEQLVFKDKDIQRKRFPQKKTPGM